MPESKKGALTTAAEMGPEHLPKGRRPEEFLDDVHLADYYKRVVLAMKPDDTRRPDAIRRAARAAEAAAGARLEAELSG